MTTNTRGLNCKIQTISIEFISVLKQRYWVFFNKKVRHNTTLQTYMLRHDTWETWETWKLPKKQKCIPVDTSSSIHPKFFNHSLWS